MLLIVIFVIIDQHDSGNQVLRRGGTLRRLEYAPHKFLENFEFCRSIQKSTLNWGEENQSEPEHQTLELINWTFGISLVDHITYQEMSRQQLAKFSTCASQLARKSYRISPHIKLRPPILPTVNNIEVKDDHPLWQFFHDKKFIRASEEVRFTGRAWTVPELRRKSFDDLHQLC
ncbi:unnamed protein product [Ambrosiozyma monospora]|uniref:Large ribosomal subunit protein uL29m n=1 Tax=Ambrosiozyma monospora TaxID=43982 RepID=A0A9W6Z4M6_AMBMO|nr:unnamed protein product [Ambrosiozyma monospora]